jgi:hypothetical protein
VPAWRLLHRRPTRYSGFNHANIDKLWAKWQKQHPGTNPPNMNETLLPKPFFGVKVAAVQRITKLGYRYA